MIGQIKNRDNKDAQLIWREICAMKEVNDVVENSFFTRVLEGLFLGSGI